MSSPEIPVEDSSPTGELRIPGSTERYADWVARMERGRGRQAAISRNLGSLSSLATPSSLATRRRRAPRPDHGQDELPRGPGDD